MFSQGSSKLVINSKLMQSIFELDFINVMYVLRSINTSKYKRGTKLPKLGSMLSIQTVEIMIVRIKKE